jgi:beta-glucosidase
VARALAEQAVVVLENDGVLPLAATTGPVAVIGPAAHDPRLLQGDYSYPAHVEIVYGSTPEPAEGNILPAAGGAFRPGPYFPPSVTPLDGIRAFVDPTVEVRFAAGGTVHDSTDAEIADAVTAATGAAVAIVVVGGKSGLLADSTTGEFRDASDLRLTGRQAELVAAVAATGTRTVVVVMSGRIHTLGDIEPHAHALCWAAPLGEEGGHGLAAVLFGAVAPSGRLPVSIPRAVGQVPVHHDHRSGGGRSQMLGDYTDGPTTPRWPFGFGRSYGVVEYADFEVSEPTTQSPATVTVRVTNRSPLERAEVVQVYGRDVVARVARPVRQLVGFERVTLAPGATRTVTFTVDPTAFAYYDEDMRLVVEPGDIELTVGPHSDARELTARVTMTGDEREITPNDRVPTRARVG